MADLNSPPREIPGLISDRHKLRREGPIDVLSRRKRHGTINVRTNLQLM